MENNNPIDINESSTNINDNSRNQGNLSSPNNFNNRIKISENISSNNVHNTKIQKNEITINSEEKIEYTENTNEIEENIEFGDDFWNGFGIGNINILEYDFNNKRKALNNNFQLSAKTELTPDQTSLKKKLDKLEGLNKEFDKEKEINKFI